MNTEELKHILDKHKQWIAGAGGERANLYMADLSGADLSGADLSGANLSRADLFEADLSRANLSGANLSVSGLSRAYLSGAKLNWNSHDILSEILKRSAGEDMSKRMIAGLVLVSRDWCWDKFLNMDIDLELRQWALETLASHDNLDGAPKCVLDAKKRSKT